MFVWLLRFRFVWLVAVFVSFVAWLEPTAWLSSLVADFAWRDFTGRLAGDVGSHALLLGMCWTLLAGLVLCRYYANPINILKYLGLIGLVVLGGSALITLASLAARDGFITNRFVYDVALFSPLFLELLLSVLAGKRLFKSCFVEGQLLGYLRVLATGFTGLIAIKLGLFILLPDTHIRLSQPLFGG